MQPPIIPIVAEMIRRAPGTISLGQGVVFYPPPPSALAEAAGMSSVVDLHRYQAVYGLPALIEEITAKLERENRITVGSGSSVVVTAGGNMAFVNALLAIVDPGDEIILQTPYYFNHEMAIAMANARAVLVPTDDNAQLQPSAVERAITSRTRAVVTISPNNPTGAVYSESALSEINRICRERGIYHISDEAYEHFTYGSARHFSPASIPGSGEHTISLFSFSKSYGMASWRLGYMVIPRALAESVNKIQDTILICPPVVSQLAGIGALRGGGDYLRERVSELAETRELVRTELRAIEGIAQITPSDGAFYFWLRLNARMDPLDLVRRLVEEHRVAAIPGTAFGNDGRCDLRISYGALDRESVSEGIGRLVEGLRAIIK